MSSNLSLALEDIIKGTKKTGLAGNLGKGRRAKTLAAAKSSDVGPRTSVRSRFPQRGFVSGDVPAGKWKHDKFFETYGGGSKKRQNVGILGRGLGGISSAGGKSTGGIAARLARKAAGIKQSGMVKMQISNLPSTVVTSDLEELFQDYNVYGIVVHYDEAGTHLGTADIFTDQQTASEILKEFKGIAIDGREIKFCIVTETKPANSGLGARVNILDRLHQVTSNPIKRRRSLQIKKRVSGGGIRKIGTARVGAAGRTRKAAASSAKAGSSSAAAKNKTAEELDMELDAYMHKK